MARRRSVKRRLSLAKKKLKRNSLNITNLRDEQSIVHTRRGCREIKLRDDIQQIISDFDPDRNYVETVVKLCDLKETLSKYSFSSELGNRVFECSARCALSVGDLTHFNTCLSTLIIRYRRYDGECKLEFYAYALLYTVYLENLIEMRSLVEEISFFRSTNVIIEHALDVARAYTSKKYYRVMRLYTVAPGMSSYIIRLFMEKVRKKVLRATIRTLHPILPVDEVEHVCAFTSSYSCIDIVDGRVANLCEISP